MSSDATVLIAANQGEIAGGEVMLLSLAEVLLELGFRPVVVAPGVPRDLISEAEARGFETLALGSGRISYGLRLRRLARRRGLLLWCNGLYPAFATGGMRRRIVHLHQLPTGFRRLMAGWSRLGALATVVPSQFMARHVLGSTVLPNWVDLPARRPRDRVGNDPSPKTHIGFLSRLSRQKGVGTLLDAFASLMREEPGQYRLSIAGRASFVDPTEAEDLERAIRDGGPAIRRLGWVDTAEFLADVDLLVVPSVVQESFGLVAAEAMAAMVPVVVSDAGALPEIVGEGHPWIFPAGDADALAGAIRDLARSLPASAVVRSGRERWERHYSRQTALRNVGRLMDDLRESISRV